MIRFALTVALLVDAANSVLEPPRLIVTMGFANTTKPCIPLLSQLMPSCLEIAPNPGASPSETERNVAQSFRLQSRSMKIYASFTVIESAQKRSYIEWRLESIE